MLFYALAFLIGFDLWLTNKRIREYGPEVELNPIVRYLARESLNLGLASLLAMNLGLLGLSAAYHPFALFLLGLKTGLGVLQLRSIYGK